MAETFNQKLELLAQKRIDEAIASHTTSVIAGNMTERNYMRATGMIAGLLEAKILIGEALTDSMKG